MLGSLQLPVTPNLGIQHFWPLQASVLICTHTHTQLKIIKRDFKNLSKFKLPQFTRMLYSISQMVKRKCHKSKFADFIQSPDCPIHSEQWKVWCFQSSYGYSWQELEFGSLWAMSHSERHFMDGRTQTSNSTRVYTSQHIKRKDNRSAARESVRKYLLQWRTCFYGHDANTVYWFPKMVWLMQIRD